MSSWYSLPLNRVECGYFDYTRSAMSSRQPGRLRHAKDVRLPVTNCGIATCLNRAIGTDGTCTRKIEAFSAATCTP